MEMLENEMQSKNVQRQLNVIERKHLSLKWIFAAKAVLCLLSTGTNIYDSNLYRVNLIIFILLQIINLVVLQWKSIVNISYG